MRVRAALLATLPLAVQVPGCDRVPLDEMGEVFYRWDGRRVLCGAALDPAGGNSIDSILGGLARAAEREETLVLYGHDPGKADLRERVDVVLARAADLDLEFVTMRDIAAGGRRRSGLALGFDDAAVDSWYATRDLFDRYGARVSFFVTRYRRLSDIRRDELRQLLADGHAIEAHGVDHLVAPDYVAEHGLDAYLRDEALPSIDALRADGFDPVSFAYPFGARTSEIDEALLEHVHLLRSISYSIGLPLVADPCPE